VRDLIPLVELTRRTIGYPDGDIYASRATAPCDGRSGFIVLKLVQLREAAETSRVDGDSILSLVSLGAIVFNKLATKEPRVVPGNWRALWRPSVDQTGTALIAFLNDILTPK
jgi:hypothetical protein